MKKLGLFLSLFAAPIVVLAATPAPSAQDNLAFARASGCMACHAVDRRLVGPSFRDISARYTGQADAKEKMVKSIREGSRGVWGPIPMPANTVLSDADIKRLAQWSLSHK